MIDGNDDAAAYLATCGTSFMSTSRFFKKSTPLYYSCCGESSFQHQAPPFAPIFAIPVAKRPRLNEEQPANYCNTTMTMPSGGERKITRRGGGKRSRRRRVQFDENGTDIVMDAEADDEFSATALFGEEEKDEKERNDAGDEGEEDSSSDDEDKDVRVKMDIKCTSGPEPGSDDTSIAAVNQRIQKILSQHQSPVPPSGVATHLLKVNPSTWVSEDNSTYNQSIPCEPADIGTSYLPVLDPFYNGTGSFAKYKAVILDYNGTITVDTFATWKSTLMAAEATVNHYRERVCDIYNAKRIYMSSAKKRKENCDPDEEGEEEDNDDEEMAPTVSGYGADGTAVNNSDIFGLTLEAIQDPVRSSLQDIKALRARMMLYDNPFSSFTCWRSCSPGSLEEYAEKAGLVSLFGSVEWEKNARQIMSTHSKMYRDFWVPRTSIPAPGLVSFVRHMEEIKMPWFIVSLHPVDKIKKELGPLLHRAGALDMLKTFVDHVTPLQLVSPVRSRYECVIDNHAYKENHTHVYCRQDKIATIEKILDELLASKNIDESDVLNIGDSVLDLQVALSLGMRFCGVHWGYCLRSTFKLHGAYVLPEYHDLAYLNPYAHVDQQPPPPSIIGSDKDTFPPPRPPTPPSAPPLNISND